jgi:hypothetical protein
MKTKDSLIRKVLEDHQFGECRGLNDYIDLFGFPFVNALKALQHMHHWLDAGSGDGRAIREYLLASSKQEVFTTAVTLKMSSSIASSTHKTIVNYLEDLNQESIRPCDIITDVEGGMQFTEAPDLLLKKYLLWTKPQGKLFIYLKPGSTWIEKGSGEIPFHEWVRSIPGLLFSEGSVPEAFGIMKEEKSHAFPRLKLVESRIEGNLIRKFREM